MQNVLVTGGAGYIGSHTCKALAAAGYLPIAYDSLVRGNRWAVKWGPLEVGDLFDEERLRQVIRTYQPLGVIHFAAYAYVGESAQEPLMYYRNNVGGSFSLLRVMAEENLRRLVFSSTCAVYGTPRTNPINESAPTRPINPYGQSKLMVEQVLQDCVRAGNLSAVALRYFNAAGADADGDVGEMHIPETHLIPLALQSVYDDSAPLTIFGDDHPTHDGTCVRDYIHVTDLASAHVKALEYTDRVEGFSAFNLGTGTGISVLDLLYAVQEVTGRKVHFHFGERRTGDPAALVADPNLALREMNWVAQHSKLDNILQTAWNWMETRRSDPSFSENSCF